MSFAGAGATLATGAPLGLVILRAGQAHDFSWDFVAADVSAQIALYGYVTFSTAIAFAAFGAVTGAQADRIDALSRVDHLTGLLNRRALESMTDQELKRAQRQRSTARCPSWTLLTKHSMRITPHASVKLATFLRNGCWRTM